MASSQSDKRLSEEVEAAVHQAVKNEEQNVDHSDMPVPPDEYEKTTEI